MGSENGNGSQVAKQELPATTLQMVIQWDQLSGQITVNGSFPNKVVCYGMLELAKEVLTEYFKGQAESGLIVSPHLRM